MLPLPMQIIAQQPTPGNDQPAIAGSAQLVTCQDHDADSSPARQNDVTEKPNWLFEKQSQSSPAALRPSMTVHSPQSATKKRTRFFSVSTRD